MVCKDEVVTWFRGQCGALRIDAMCALLDCCLPYELRYVGTILENLGKRDFHELREVENRANEFATHSNPEENKKALFNLLSDTNQQSGVLPNSVSHAPSSAHTNSTNSHEAPSRPSPTHTTDQKMWPHWNGEPSLHHSTVPTSLSLTQKSRTLSGVVGSSLSHMNGSSSGCLSNCKNCMIEESDKNDGAPAAPVDMGALSDERKRHKLTLYFSLLRVSNRVCASAFYSVLAHVDQTVNCDNWLEGRDENTLEELALLYTMASNHPAFTFDQRTVVSASLARIRTYLQALQASRIPKNYPPPQTYLAPGFDQKYCYFVPYVPQIQHQVQVPQPPVGGVVGNIGTGAPLSSVDISRLPPQMGYTFPQFSQYPVFVQAHNQTPIPNHVGKNLGPLNTKSPSLQQSISLDSGWTQKKHGKEKGEFELDQSTFSATDQASTGRSRKVGCYNCGSQSHLGQECQEATIEEITKYFYRINYSNGGAESS